MIESGKIVSIVDEVYPMERAADAHRKVETEQRLGAIVIEIGRAAKEVDGPPAIAFAGAAPVQ